jgi:hypothetical protein
MCLARGRQRPDDPGEGKDVGLARHKDDLSFEPSLHEALTDPVIQAVMHRDGVSRDELVQLILVARARLMPRETPQRVGPPSVTNVLPFPVHRPVELDSAELRPDQLRPRTRWPFCVGAPGQKARSSPEKK